MSVFNPKLALIRFGTGCAIGGVDPLSAQALLNDLQGEDLLAQRYPMEPLSALMDDLAEYRAIQRRGKKGEPTRRERESALRSSEQARARADLATTLARGVAAQYGVRDRLTWFWADHFAVRGRTPFLANRTDTFVEETIRPVLTGRFETMLQRAVLHPVMLTFLDQSRSVGPGSAFAARPGQEGRGLNENLAREVLELHTLGADGGYSQKDVRQLAELLAGVSVGYNTLQTQFRPERAEPGAETVMGFRSSADEARMEDVKGLLAHLARADATAAHISRKLAVHFLSDTPPEDLVAEMTNAWRRGGGDLMLVYERLMTHPAATALPMAKVKRPIELIVSGLRAMGADAEGVAAMGTGQGRPIRRFVQGPMRRMGQDWARPEGPDGWPEEEAAWITPATLAERLKWANMAQSMPGVPRSVSPVEVMQTALGEFAGERLQRAITGAETRRDAVALVLAAPEFQRR